MAIRISAPSDWPRIVAIYNDGVATGHSTADTEPATVESKKAWLEDHADPKFPIYVEEQDRVIRRWCSLSPYRCGRSALRHTAEIS